MSFRGKRQNFSGTEEENNSSHPCYLRLNFGMAYIHILSGKSPNVERYPFLDFVSHNRNRNGGSLSTTIDLSRGMTKRGPRLYCKTDVVVENHFTLPLFLSCRKDKVNPDEERVDILHLPYLPVPIFIPFDYYLPTPIPK